ncbi:hypothetical protein R3P38DRAFT_2813707 [Favolaschia claudopus]|uniref:Uncharacterized protein n=1 Tax=Favolaschia claudopus TaxID=2862362 RepID=A0AAV9Z4P6_9AGAR
MSTSMKFLLKMIAPRSGPRGERWHHAVGPRGERLHHAVGPRGERLHHAVGHSGERSTTQWAIAASEAPRSGPRGERKPRAAVGVENPSRPGRRPQMLLQFFIILQ